MKYSSILVIGGLSAQKKQQKIAVFFHLVQFSPEQT